MGEVTRRNFLKGALAVGAAGIAGTALSGCSNAEASASSDMPKNWDKEVDVLIVGAGSGLAAGVKAAEAGSDVLIVEKSDHPGGFWMASGGGCTMGGNNIVQQRAGETDDNETWFEDEMFSCSYRGDADIMRTFVERGAETVQWMEDLGMKWGGSVPRVPPREDQARFVAGRKPRRVRWRLGHGQKCRYLLDAGLGEPFERTRSPHPSRA